MPKRARDESGSRPSASRYARIRFVEEAVRPERVAIQRERFGVRFLAGAQASPLPAWPCRTPRCEGRHAPCPCARDRRPVPSPARSPCRRPGSPRGSGSRRTAGWRVGTAVRHRPGRVSARIASVQPATIAAAVNARRNVLGITGPPRGSSQVSWQLAVRSEPIATNESIPTLHSIGPTQFHCRCRCPLPAGYFWKYSAFTGMIAFPLLRRLVEREDRFDRTRRYARAAIDALVRMNIQLSAASNPGSSLRGWMQSTGHTSTQALSFVPMHGSQMIYATPSPTRLDFQRAKYTPEVRVRRIMAGSPAAPARWGAGVRW